MSQTNDLGKHILETLIATDQLIHDPSSVETVVYNKIAALQNNQLDIVDPTNPLSLAISTACATATAAMEHNIINLSKVYPVIAQTRSDLYRHMSDIDYLSIFAQPSDALFTVAIQKRSFINHAVDSADSKYKYVRIARDTEVSVDGTTYSFNYPMDIRLYDNKQWQAHYINDFNSTIEELSTNRIRVTEVSLKEEGEYLLFKVPLKQVQKTIANTNTVQGSTFIESLDFTDSYFTSRVLHLKEGTWIDIPVSFNNDVYDINKPIALVHVESNKLTVTIPEHYIKPDVIDGRVKIIVYTTKGVFKASFGDNKIADFVSVGKDLMTGTLNQAESGFSNTSYHIYSDVYAEGGRKALTFEELKERVITNTIGNALMPITNKSLVVEGSDYGYDIIKHHDTLLDRVFIGIKEIVRPNDIPLMETLNTGMSKLTTSLKDIPTTRFIRKNGSRVTLLEGCLLALKGSSVTLASTVTTEHIVKDLALDKVIKELNHTKVQYLPFAYVLDSSGSTVQARAYQLNKPVILHQSFINSNTSTNLTINTEKKEILHTGEGYTINIATLTSSFVKNVTLNKLKCIIRVISKDSKTPYYYPLTVSKSDDGEILFTGVLKSNFDVDIDNNIGIGGLTFNGVDGASTMIPMDSVIDVIYAIDDVVPGFKDDTLKQYLPDDASLKVLTVEKFTLSFGKQLTHLWTGVNSVHSGARYQTHTSDIPYINKKDVFEVNPKTGSILCINPETCQPFYKRIAKKGDPSKDVNGAIIYKYRKGDVKLDNKGFPIPLVNYDMINIFDLLTFDAKWTKVTCKRSLAYLNECLTHILYHADRGIQKVQDRVIENTTVYYMPKVSLPGDHTINDKELTLSFVLSVEKTIFDDVNAREQIKAKTHKVITSLLRERLISFDIILCALREAYNKEVISIGVDNKNNDMLNNVIRTIDYDNGSMLRLPTKLKVTNTNSITIEDVISIQFKELIDK